MGYIEESETIKKRTNILPCVKCCSENIEIDDCGYSTFNVAWGKCLDCKNEITISPCGCDIKKSYIAKIWNEANDPKILRDKYEKQIEDIQKKINELPK